MTEKFTKGEWPVESNLLDVTVWNGEGDRICDTGNRYFSQNINNAHLIAAAPEMYEMLKKVIEISCGNNEIEVADDLVNISNEIETLLAKARGEHEL